MLYPVYRLETDRQGQWRVAPSGRRALRRAVLIVPRELCVFDAAPCAGVAWYEMRGFARLQVARLAPFSRPGASAAARNKTLMCWFWDNAELDKLLAQADPAIQAAQRMAEPLWLAAPPGGSGVRELACTGGADVQTLRAGAIVDSAWKARPNAPAPTLTWRPWSIDLIGHTAPGATGEAWTTERGLMVLGLASVAACGGYAAYWGGTLLGTGRQVSVLEATAQRTTTELGDWSGLQRQASADSSWTRSYLQQSASFRLGEFLGALTPALRNYGVVIKEMEIRRDDARLVLVSAGSDIDLPGLLNALATTPGMDNVQLRQNTELSQAVFSISARSFLQPVNAPVPVGP